MFLFNFEILPGIAPLFRVNAYSHNRSWARSYLRLLTGLLLLFVCSRVYATEDLSPPVTNQTAFEKSIQTTWNKLQDNCGITPFVSYWGDFMANPSGGKTQSTAWFQLLEFGGTIDFSRYGWKGGSFYAAGSYASGDNLSNQIGNTFTVAQAVVGMTSVGLDEMYLTQKVGENDCLQFSVGRKAAGTNFATLPIEGLAVSGAANSNPSSLYYNAPFDIMTGATWAAFARMDTTVDTYTQVGVYQADPRSDVAAYHGVGFSFRSTDGLLVVAETGWTPTFGQTKETLGKDGKTMASAQPGYPGIYQVGAYYSNYTFPTFGGGSQPNAYGFYLQWQQMIWRDSATPDLNLTIWGGVTCSPQDQIALLPVMGFGGADLHGPLPGRRNDSLFMNAYLGGFSSADSSLSIANGNGYLTRETVFEWGYVVQVTKNTQFQPDVQYINRPSGTDNIPNAVVIGFQVSALF